MTITSSNSATVSQRLTALMELHDIHGRPLFDKSKIDARTGIDLDELLLSDAMAIYEVHKRSVLADFFGVPAAYFTINYDHSFFLKIQLIATTNTLRAPIPALRGSAVTASAISGLAEMAHRGKN